MKIAIIVFLFIVFIITIRINIKIEFQYNVFLNNGNLKIRLFKFLTLYNKEIVFLGLYLKVTNKKNKSKFIKIDFQDKSIKFITDLQYYIKNKIYLTKFDLYTVVGNETSCNTCVMYEVAKLFFLSIYYKVYNFERDAQINMQIFPNFANNNFEVYASIEFVLSFFDMIYGFLQTILEGGNVIYEKKRR